MVQTVTNIDFPSALKIATTLGSIIAHIRALFICYICRNNAKIVFDHENIVQEFLAVQLLKITF
jgi:hypothetical protein